MFNEQKQSPLWIPLTSQWSFWNNSFGKPMEPHLSGFIPRIQKYEPNWEMPCVRGKVLLGQHRIIKTCVLATSEKIYGR